MGEFVLPDRIAVLALDGGDFDGAEVRANIRIPVWLIREHDRMVDDKDTTGSAYHDQMVKWFRERGFRGWNLADENGPLPEGDEGWDRLDFATQRAIFRAWIRGAVQPSAPLPPKSSAGGRSRARSRSPKS